MKKNLQLALALTLGLATTVSAQDWSVDSRTRVNNFDTEMSTDQRVRMGVDFGGDAVSVHTSFNAAATLGAVANEEFSFGVREAYASTDVLGYATVSAGRMALNLGSGRIVGTNDFVQGNGNTWDGFLANINNDFADINFGYASTNMDEAYDATQMIVNAAKDMGDMSFNLTYVSTEEAVSASEGTMMGLEGTYAMANGVDLSFGYYTGDDNGTESGLTSIGASYGINDDLTAFASYDMYDENGFYSAAGSFGTGFGFGSAMDYSNMDDCTDMTIGACYKMGDMSFKGAMHSISNEAATRDFSVMDLSFGYSLTDNSSLSVTYSSTDEGEEDDSRMWIGFSMGF